MSKSPGIQRNSDFKSFEKVVSGQVRELGVVEHGYSSPCPDCEYVLHASRGGHECADSSFARFLSISLLLLTQCLQSRDEGASAVPPHCHLFLSL